MESKGNVLTVLTPRSTETLRSPESSDLIKQRKKKFTGYVANIIFGYCLNMLNFDSFESCLIFSLDKFEVFRVRL